MDIAQILNVSNLPTLSQMEPLLWEEVFKDLKERVSSGNGSSLGSLREKNTKILNQWRGAVASPLAASHHAKESVLRAHMTVLAIDQFADVMTGKLGGTPSLKDRVVFQAIFARMLARHQGVSTKDFDRYWSWIKDRLWAAGEIQRRGYWSVPTLEFVERMKQQAAGRTVLEIGAGRGYLAKLLGDAGAAVHACDDFSWAGSKGPETLASVQDMNADTALKTLKPSFVICSWPPPGNHFEEKIFATPSVQTYIAIVSEHKFAAGNWLAYQRQSQFNCSSSAPLNQLLRPLEAEQHVLIFRRR